MLVSKVQTTVQDSPMPLLKFDTWYKRVLIIFIVISLFGICTSLGIVAAQETMAQVHRNIVEATQDDQNKIIDYNSQRITKIEALMEQEKEYHQKINDLDQRMQRIEMQHSALQDSMERMTNLLLWLGGGLSALIADLLRKLLAPVIVGYFKKA